MPNPPSTNNKYSYYGSGRDFKRLWQILEDSPVPLTIAQIAERYGPSEDSSFFAKRIWICSRLNAWFHANKILRPAKATYASLACPNPVVEIPNPKDCGPGEGDGDLKLLPKPRDDKRVVRTIQPEEGRSGPT